jgi:glycosyltransferase involved in cell wall biosynthesis
MTDVTVLIPARNAAATLAETLDTLVAQTYRNFRVLIVNDDSSDNTAAIALGYRPRLDIDVLSLASNAGVAGALNQGLAQIQTKYIARIDADDLALPTRLEKQVACLEARPELDVCSTWMELFYEAHTGRAPQILVKPQDDATIKTALVQYCSMSHGASMFRKSFFDDVGVFDTRLDFAEDYDLWTRGALLGKRYTNLPEALTRYRQHANQVGQQKRQLQYERDLMIKRKYISALLGGESPGYLAEFFSLLTVFSSKEIAISVVEQSLPLLLKLSRRLYDDVLFGEIAAASIGRHLRN